MSPSLARSPYSGPGGRMHTFDLLIAVGALLLLRLLRLTWRFEVLNPENRTAAEKAHPSGGFAMAIWHEHLFATIAAHAGQKFAPLASLSRDGDVVSWVMDHLGFCTLRGSSSRGGTEARLQLIHALEQGYFTALTVDGPRGPRRVAKMGIVEIARRTGAAILPVSTTGARSFIFAKSWDRFRLPLPFTKITVTYGKPILVPTDLQRRQIEPQRQLVDAALNDLNDDDELNEDDLEVRP